MHSDSEHGSNGYPLMDSGAPTLSGPRPPLDSDSNPSKAAPSPPSLNVSANNAPEEDDAIGLARGIVSGVGDIEINGATPLVTTVEGVGPAIEVATAAGAGITAGGAEVGASTAGTTTAAWEGGDAQGTGAAVMGLTMVAEGTVLLVVLPAPPATLPPVMALGNENTPTDAMDFRELATRRGEVYDGFDVDD